MFCPLMAENRTLQNPRNGNCRGRRQLSTSLIQNIKIHLYTEADFLFYLKGNKFVDRVVDKLGKVE